MKTCIRMGITVFKFVILGGISAVYGLKLHFTAPLTRGRKTEFAIVKPLIYLPK